MAGIKPDQFWGYKRDTGVHIYYREVSKQAQRNDIAWKEIEAHGMSWNAMEPWTLDGNQCSCDIIPRDSNLNKKVT